MAFAPVGGLRCCEPFHSRLSARWRLRRRQRPRPCTRSTTSPDTGTVTASSAGYRPPEVIARERAEHYERLYGPHYYGPAWPRFYRGRWNGGGFGPCYTYTPIGYMWNCGQ